jgi:hypothetical protein
MSTTSLAASADAYVRDGTYAANNYGTEASLSVQKSGSGFNKVGYVKFDVAAVQGGVDKAVLRLYGRFAGGGSAAVAVQSVAESNWGEQSLNWNNRPAAGGQVGTATFGGAYSWVDVDVTQYVAAAKAGGSAAVSFALSEVQSVGAQVIVNAKEGGNRAALVVTTGDGTTIPDPGPDPTPSPPPPPATEPPPAATTGKPQFFADAADMSLRYTGGKVTLPGGRVVTVAGGTLNFANPTVQTQVYRNHAPQNYDGRPYNKRWQDAAANLMPPSTRSRSAGRTAWSSPGRSR